MPKAATKLLPNDRAYTEVEALFCLALDHNNGKAVTMEGYSKLWGWTRKKTRLFLPRVGLEIMYPEDTKEVRKQRGILSLKMGPLKGHKRGHITFIDYRHLQGQRDISGAINGATTHDNKKEEKKRGRKAPPDPRVKCFISWFLSLYKKRFSTDYLITNWGQVGAQTKKLLGSGLSWEDLQFLTIEFLLDEDQWLQKVGHNLGTLQTRIGQNAYVRYRDPGFREGNRHNIIDEDGTPVGSTNE